MNIFISKIKSKMKQPTYYIIFILFLSLFFFTKASASTYYLAPTGNDISGSGTIESPWFTLNKAWTVIQAGDTVYLRGGTYTYQSKQLLSGKNGTAQNKISVFAYPGETPNLTTNQTTWSMGSWPYSLITLRGDYFHWKGIEISNCINLPNGTYAGAMSVLDSDYNIFEMFNIHHCAHGLQIMTTSTENLVLNSDFHHNANPYDTSDPYGGSDGIEFVNSNTGVSNTMRGCRLYWNSDDGLDMYRNDGAVTVEDTWSFYNGYIPDTFTEGGDGNGFKLGLTDDDHGASILITAKNNIAYKNRTSGFHQNGAIAAVAMYNNTSYLNGGQGFWLASYNKPNKVVNNISYGNNGYSALTAESTVTTNNFLINNSANPAYSVNNSDFVSLDQSQLLRARNSDGSLPDIDFLKLAEGSDLINTGTDIGINYNGSNPDLGAFESNYQVVVIPPSDITPPSITSFSIPTTSTTLSISGITFSATDAVGVAGYLLSESSTTPSASSGSWSSTPPTSYTFTSIGTKTLYAFAKDTAGNVSASMSDGITIGSDTTALTIEGTTTTNTVTGLWSGVNVSRTTPTVFTYRNNSVTSVNASGYLLQAGDESPNAYNNNLNGEIITGNKLTWNGTDITSITHGIFTGYNINALIKYNYAEKLPMSIIRKSNGMTNTSGGVAYNIINKTPKSAVVVKGMNNVNIYNNTIYSTQTMYNSSTGTGTWRGLIDIYNNIDGGLTGAYSSGTKIKNNIFYTKYQIYNIKIDNAECLTDFESDYNIFYSESGTPLFNYLGQVKTFAQWQALGYDTHSIVVNPNFNNFTEFVPNTRLDYGTNLGSTWQEGLSTNAVWNVGYSPATTNQNGTWQVGARIAVASALPTTYTLSYTANANGTLTGTTSQTINSGASGTAITAVPSTGYYFVSWSDSSTSNPRTDANVTANKSVSATFAITPVVTGAGGGGGGGASSTTTITCPTGTTLVNTTCVTNTTTSATLIDKAKQKDIKPDGSINIIDFNIIMANWNKTYTKDISLTKGDITGDGLINIFDMNQLMVMWGVKY